MLALMNMIPFSLSNELKKGHTVASGGHGSLEIELHSVSTLRQNMYKQIKSRLVFDWLTDHGSSVR